MWLPDELCMRVLQIIVAKESVCVCLLKYHIDAYSEKWKFDISRFLILLNMFGSVSAFKK